MITFKSNKYNDEYLVLTDRFSLFYLGQSQKLNDELLKEINQMFVQLYRYEKENGHIQISEINLRKDSLLGQYLLNSYDYEIINEDLYIYDESVKNALLISIYNNSEIFERIKPLFRKNASGYKKELLKEYDEEVLDYILKNNDYEQFINSEEKESNECVVFENGKYIKKILTKDKTLLKEF